MNSHEERQFRKSEPDRFFEQRLESTTLQALNLKVQRFGDSIHTQLFSASYFTIMARGKFKGKPKRGGSSLA